MRSVFVHLCATPHPLRQSSPATRAVRAAARRADARREPAGYLRARITPAARPMPVSTPAPNIASRPRRCLSWNLRSSAAASACCFSRATFATWSALHFSHSSAARPFASWSRSSASRRTPAVAPRARATRAGRSRASSRETCSPASRSPATRSSAPRPPRAGVGSGDMFAGCRLERARWPIARASGWETGRRAQLGHRGRRAGRHVRRLAQFGHRARASGRQTGRHVRRRRAARPPRVGVIGSPRRCRSWASGRETCSSASRSLAT